MTHTYHVSGMTCGGCQAKVQNLLSKIAGVKNVSIDLAKGEATIDMNKTLPTRSTIPNLVPVPPISIPITSCCIMKIKSLKIKGHKETFFEGI